MSGDREVSAEERERWRQVTALVDAAFDLPASERESSSRSTLRTSPFVRR